MTLSMSFVERILSASPLVVVLLVWCVMPGRADGQARPAMERAIGTVSKIDGDSLTIVPDSGGEVKANLSSSTRMLRVAAGEKDLKNATAITLRDLQVGDRVLVRGQTAADGHAITALALVVMKQVDVSAKQKQDEADWQQHGSGGLVTAVDAVRGTITLSSGGLGQSRSVLVRTTKDTILRRYAPNSTKFNEARPAPLDQIKAGDQLLARGEFSKDRSSLNAEEVVSGTFRNIAGNVTGVNPEANTVTVQDLIAKSEVQMKISPDSQIKKIPPEMAQRIAMRLKAEAGRGSGENGSEPPSGARTDQGSNEVREGAGRQGRGQAGRTGGGPDLQRLLGRLPSSALADLHRGDAVMVVSTLGEDPEKVTAITVLAGVEPILAAAPSRGASAALSVWALGAPSMEGVSEP